MRARYDNTQHCHHWRRKYGASLVGGLIKNGQPAAKIIATDPSPDKLGFMKSTFGIQVTDDNEEAVKHASVVIFAIKPQLFETVALALKEVIAKQKPLVISIAAGVRIKIFSNGSAVTRPSCASCRIHPH